MKLLIKTLSIFFFFFFDCFSARLLDEMLHAILNSFEFQTNPTFHPTLIWMKCWIRFPRSLHLTLFIHIDTFTRLNSNQDVIFN